MALHGKTEKTAKQKRARATKPSRSKRIARRWNERIEAMRECFATREYAFVIWPVLRRMLPQADEGRAYRIGKYLAKRAERKAMAKAA